MISQISPISHCWSTLYSSTLHFTVSAMGFFQKEILVLNSVIFQLICKDNKAIFWMVLDLMFCPKMLEPTRICQNVSLQGEEQVWWDWIRTPVEWLTAQPPPLNNDAHHPPRVLIRHTDPWRAKQRSVLHRYSIGFSFSHMQSQCWGREGGVITFLPIRKSMKKKSQVVGLTVGTLLVLLQTSSPRYKKK